MSGTGTGSGAARPATTPTRSAFQEMLRNDYRNVFFNTDEFGTLATIGTASVKGRFENKFMAVNGVESMVPTFEAVDDDVSTVAHSSTLTIVSTTYKVVGIQPTNRYTVLLILSRD